MDIVKSKIKSIEAKIENKKSTIQVAEREIEVLEQELFSAKWRKISWDELENWLKENRPENNYERNPIVCDGSEYRRKSYCKLNSDGKLQIGAYSSTDFFEKSRNSLYVTYDFEPYR